MTSIPSLSAIPEPYRTRFMARFWKYTNIRHDGCWEWQSCKDKDGYGKLYCQQPKGNASVHRISFELHHGPIPAGYFVCHHCDNPSCVNPTHLYAGTVVDNNRDRVNRNRSRDQRGSKSPTAKLHESDVLAIHDAVRNGAVQRHLAGKYGVSPSTICMIVSGKVWPHVKLPSAS